MAKNKDDGSQQDDTPARKLDESPREGGLYVKNGRAVDAVGAWLKDWIVDLDGNPVQINIPNADAGK